MFENKKLLQGLITVGIISLSIFFLAKAAESARGYNRETPPTITVTGEGEYFAVPDTATFSFTVEREGNTQKEASDKGATAMNAILGSLEKDFSIAEKDVKTTSLYVNPKYEYNNPPRCLGDICPSYPVPSNPKIVGYTFSQSVSVKVRDMDKAGEVAAKLAELGATNVYGPDFTLDDEDMAKEEARMEAIKDAKIKARKLSSQLGVRLGKVSSFSEGYGGGYPIYGMGGATDMAVRQEKSVAPELPAGENKYTSQVTITYEIR